MKKSKSSFVKYEQRWAQVRGLLAQQKVDACLIENSVDMFYLLGERFSLGSCVITRDAFFCCVDGRYHETANDLPGVEVRNYSLKGLGHIISTLPSGGVVLFDSKDISYKRFVDIESVVAGVGRRLQPQESLLQGIRLCKTDDEIELLKESAKINRKAYEYVSQFVKEGISEQALACEFRRFLLDLAVDEVAFDPIIAFGANTAKPHHHPGMDQWTAEQPILFDVGVVYQGYASDMTRVYVPKKAPALFHKMYEVVLAAYDAAVSLCAPGHPVGDLDESARMVMRKFGMEDLFVHSLGHGLGLSVHEFPTIRSVGVDRDFQLQPGMVITIEPGLYQAGVGGVRYENTLLITKTGCELM